MSALRLATHVPVIPAPALESPRADNAPELELEDTPWVTFAADDHPPPEPPPPDSIALSTPVDLQLDDVLDAIPPKDRDAFVDQYLCDKAVDIYSQPEMTHDINHRPAVSRHIVPQNRGRTTTPPLHCELVTYQIPLDKARPSKDSPYPQGSLMDPSILIRPVSPATPFEFPFDGPTPSRLPDLGYNPSTYVPFASVTQVVGLPRVCGLTGNGASFARVMHAAILTDASDNPSLMDGGANICITSILGLLVDVISIPPIPISVATTSGSISINDCCTKQGLTPLTLTGDSIYYQPCYYCKNTVETIISMEAIVAASNTLVHCTQEGHKGSDPGSICFSSESGLYLITLSLEKWDGLYYCPTDVFTIDCSPSCPAIPLIKCATAPPQPATPCCGRRYFPVMQDRMAKSKFGCNVLNALVKINWISSPEM